MRRRISRAALTVALCAVCTVATGCERQPRTTVRDGSLHLTPGGWLTIDSLALRSAGPDSEYYHTELSIDAPRPYEAASTFPPPGFIDPRKRLIQVRARIILAGGDTIELVSPFGFTPQMLVFPVPVRSPVTVTAVQLRASDTLSLERVQWWSGVHKAS